MRVGPKFRAACCLSIIDIYDFGKCGCVCACWCGLTGLYRSAMKFLNLSGWWSIHVDGLDPDDSDRHYFGESRDAME